MSGSGFRAEAWHQCLGIVGVSLSLLQLLARVYESSWWMEIPNAVCCLAVGVGALRLGYVPIIGLRKYTRVGMYDYAAGDYW